MEGLTKRSNRASLISYAIIACQTVAIILLILQNKELKATLGATSLRAHADALKPGEQVEPFIIQTLSGQTSFISYTDPAKQYLLFVLSTTCPHCQKTLANWNSIAVSKKGGDCTIIGISLDDVDKTRKYAVAQNVGFYLVAAADTTFSRKYKITGVPVTILIDGSGVVEKSWVGELTSDQTEEVHALLSAQVALTN